MSAPLCFAASATTADAPEPVPPPIPETTKTMSDPPTIWLIWSNDSSADARPIAGLPPAPSPRGVAAPSPRRLGLSDASSAWMSVLIVQYSTASRSPCPNWIIRFTALPPPPPTPTTLITHGDATATAGDARRAENFGARAHRAAPTW